LGNTISVGSKSEVYFLEEDFENIALYMVDGDLYSCNIIGHRIVNAVISVSPRVENFLVPVTVKFENGVDDIAVWENYFTKFCTIEVFEKIFGRQKVVRRFGNTLYHTQLYPTKTEFELGKIDESLITVLS